MNIFNRVVDAVSFLLGVAMLTDGIWGWTSSSTTHPTVSLIVVGTIFILLAAAYTFVIDKPKRRGQRNGE